MAMAMADPEIEVAPISISISTPPAPPHDALPSTSTATTLDADDSCGFDVFINHRGPDVKNTFASHLYRRLLQRGLRVFLDKPELQQGLNLTLQIQRAIRTASVHVAVFSPRYAESKWCLDELLQMLESEAIVIPVFYHVKPAQLRWTDRVSSQDLTDGVYSQDLRKLAAKTTYDTRTHQNKPRHDPETIQKWREALSRVADISGFELDANNTDEGELLDKIVERVVKNVKKRNLDETAKDSENTALLEQQQQKLGKLEVLSLCSAGASSPAVPVNIDSANCSGLGQGPKGGSLSGAGSWLRWTSVSTSAGESALGSSQLSCRPWERADLLKRLATFKPANWSGKPKMVCNSLAVTRENKQRDQEFLEYPFEEAFVEDGSPSLNPCT